MSTMLVKIHKIYYLVFHHCSLFKMVMLIILFQRIGDIVQNEKALQIHSNKLCLCVHCTKLVVSQ